MTNADVCVSEVETEEQPEREEKERKCLVCNRMFVSEWAGERVCKRCRSSAIWRQSW